MKTIKQLEQEAKQAREDGFSITESQLSLLKDIFDYDDEWLMRHISIKLLGHRNIVLEIDHINDCDYKDLEAWQEVSGDGSGKALPELSQEERDSDGWRVWNGGSCPLDENIKVELKFRSSQYENITDYAGGFSWYPKDDGTDIIAYKIVKGE